MKDKNIHKCSPWYMDDLLRIYRMEVVPCILSQGWAIDEMVCGVSQDVLIEEIWKGYETWAYERISKEINSPKEAVNA